MEQAASFSAVKIDVGLSPGPVAEVVMDWPDACGAEVVFLGRTRRERHEKYGALVRLEYEAYGPMVEKLLGEMARDAAAKWDCYAVRMLHAHGPVLPGEASIVIQVATPHRSEAFLAGKYLIDRVKHELPVWKREVWERGTTFVEGCCVSSGRTRHESTQRDGSERT
jgi:molybdopterin synthase catalytic subunit